jgi:hypothetical protein
MLLPPWREQLKVRTSRLVARAFGFASQMMTKQQRMTPATDCQAFTFSR